MRNTRTPVVLVLLLAASLLLSCAAPERGVTSPTTGLVQQVYLTANQRGFLPKEIVVKSLTLVRLFVTSFDEEYYIEIPDMKIGPTKVLPFKDTVLTFTPMGSGSFEFRNPFLPNMRGVLAVQVCPLGYLSRQNPIPFDETSVAAGRLVYSSFCVDCHGSGGKGDGPKAGGLHTRPIDLTQPYMDAISDGEMFWAIDQGLAGMPSFGTVLSDDLKWDVINYIRSLRQK
ncbi:MAG: c-type cytochrome [Chloroflexota bacterium]